MSEREPIPDVIYLQWGNPYNQWGVMWCPDKIYDDDIEYVKRTPLTDAAPDLLEAVIMALPFVEGKNNYVEGLLRAAIAKAERIDNQPASD